MSLRRKTNPFSNSNLITEHKGVSRNCLTCGLWKSTEGFKKHPFRNYMECKQCVALRQNKTNEAK